jgi:hypothetical protein|tara:strand:+ start:283 stop:456 length:174 start_codon:yes stop_codon:yes gene_type:complete
MPNTYLVIEDVLKEWKVVEDIGQPEYNTEAVEQHKQDNDIFELFYGYIAYKNNKGRV